jgi:hypothetical protein
MILSSSGNPVFATLKRDKNATPAIVLYDIYYDHLFSISPSSAAFMSNTPIQKRSRALLRMISSILTMCGSKDELDKLRKIAEFHSNELGVEPDLYVISSIHSLS